ncbi:MAG: hypothetical protein JWN88_752 [Frankiales bacterium]|jgi:cell division inhibitor SepF|nr:hypothetical protein [Frankiales bacterium]
MPGAMHKLGLWLGLVEADDETRDRRYADDTDAPGDELEPVATASSRRWSAPERDAAAETRATPIRRSSEPTRAGRGSVALDPAPRISAAPPVDDTYRITTLHPRTYNEARTIGEHFRQGTPVIINLTEMDDVDAKRLVDFAAGLIFGLRGSIERVTNKVFLLSPEHVKVTAEDKARIAEGGFFNQS